MTRGITAFLDHKVRKLEHHGLQHYMLQGRGLDEKGSISLWVKGVGDGSEDNNWPELSENLIHSGSNTVKVCFLHSFLLPELGKY